MKCGVLKLVQTNMALSWAVIISAFCFAFWGPSAAAQDYRTQIQLNSSFNYDENRRLGGQPGLPTEAARIIINPVWTNRIASERYEIDAIGGVSVTESFDDDVERDRIDYDTQFQLAYRYPTSQITAGAAFTKRSQFDAQFADAGVLGEDAITRSYQGNLGFSQQLSETWSLDLNGSVQQQDNTGLLLNSFFSYNASIGANKLLSPKWTIGLFASGQRQETEDTSIGPQFGNSTSGSVFVQSTYRVAEYWTVTGQAGVIQVDNIFANTTSWQASAGLEYDYQRWTISAEAERGFFPSGNGTFRRTTGGDLSAIYAFTSRMSVNFGGLYRNSEVFGFIQGEDRQIQASAGFRWRIVTNVALNIQYQYRDQRLAFNGQDASGNAVSVALEFFYPQYGLNE